MILGAGGKMGLHVSRMAHEAIRRSGAPASVIAVSRFKTLRDRAAFEEAGITTLACDLSDAHPLAQLPDADLVFFLAGVKFGTANDPDLLHQMNVVVPRLVAQRYPCVPIVAFSTGCVYPFVPVESRGASEQTPPAPVGDYAISCRGREEEFMAASRGAGTPVVLIRLNYAVEFRYGVLVDIAARVHSGTPIDVTTGHVNVIWQRDAVEQILRASSVAASPAIPLNITGAGTHSVRAIAEDFGRLFGVAPTFTGTESPTAWLNDASESHRLFGPPPTSLAAMQAWIAAWLQNEGGTWGKPTGFEQRNGKF